MNYLNKKLSKNKVNFWFQLLKIKNKDLPSFKKLVNLNIKFGCFIYHSTFTVFFRHKNKNLRIL